MKWAELLTRFTDRSLFHSSWLQDFGESKEYTQVQISRWVNNGKLIQIRRGWYLIAEPYRALHIPPEMIANKIVTPSYLSLEWALSYYGLIPEGVPNPTSVTTARAVDFWAVDCMFIYNHIKPDYFSGYSEILSEEHKILVATPEKALWDKLYLHLRSRRFSIHWLKELRLQNLEDFRLSKWRDYMRLTSLASLRRASAEVEKYIQEVRR